ncbi:MAG: DUF3164 family protein [Bacteroidales bacterium]|nr:DUF3164 family protein [Bacteroidales bacterium]
MEKTTVKMSAEELAEYEAFKAEREKKAAEERRKQQRLDYTKMVDDELAAAIPELQGLSEEIKIVKARVFDNFKTIIDLKGEMFRDKKGQEMGFASHTFTSSDGSMRLKLGQYLNDNYLDTAEDGVAMINEYIAGLATDEKTQALVNMVLKLLAKDSKGTLKAQRILQLRKIAEESGAEKFIEGVRIIEEAYSPIPTRTFLQAAIKDPKTGGWKQIPLGMTES